MGCEEGVVSVVVSSVSSVLVGFGFEEEEEEARSPVLLVVWVFWVMVRVIVWWTVSRFSRAARVAAAASLLRGWRAAGWRGG